MKMNLLRCFLVFFLGTMLLNFVPTPVAQAEPIISVSPSMSYAEPGGSFNVTLGLVQAIDVFSWQVNMSFDPTILEFQDAWEGDFLKDQPEGTSGLIKAVYTGYVGLIVSTRGDYAGVDGRGTLATVEFKVKDGVIGETILNISDPGVWNPKLGYHVGGTQLLDHLDREITRTTVDGYFDNTDYPPVASFTYSPSLPEVAELVYFNASASYDPDGEIIRYEWDFGDGNSVNETAPTTTHAYTDFGIYVVTLTVIDNASRPRTWYEFYSTAIEEVETRSPHNVAVFTVTAYPSTVVAGESVSVNVTVTNKGSWNETFTVNIYYDDHSAAPAQTVTNLAPDANKILSFTWDTTDVPPGIYRINATASVVEAELNLVDNSKLSGTITVEEAGAGFPIEIVAIAAVVVVVGIAAAFLLLRRRSSPTA